MTGIKNIIRILYRENWDNAANLAGSENKKQAAVENVIAYAGFRPEEVVLDRVELTGDGLCRVDFRNLKLSDPDAPACGMSWCSYVDTATGEVVGFAGDTERASIDMEEPA